MKKALFSAIVLLAALASCSKKQDTVPVLPSEDVKMVPVTFTAGVDTKTHLGNDGTSVIWQSGDQISVFANGTNYQFTLVSGANSSSGTFAGEMSETDAAASEFYALYPYESTATINDGVISTIGSPNVVNNVTNNFPNKAVQSVAHTTDGNFNFKIVCALLKVTVPSEMGGLLKGIMVSANGGEKYVGGKASVTLSEELTVGLQDLDEKNKASADVQTTKNEGIAAGTYYLPVYPTSLSKGLRVKLTYVDNRTPEYLFNGKVISLERAKILNVGTLHPQPTYIFDDFESFPVSGSGSGELKFQDLKYITGNSGAIKVVANPCQTEANPSEKVLANDMHTAGWATSGYVQFSFGQDPIKFKFPYAARDKFKGVRFKIYIGESNYYPRLQINANGDWGNKLPSKVNDTVRTSDAQYEELLRHNDWNLLEFNLTSCGYSKSNFGALNDWQIRPFIKIDGGNCDAALSDTNQKLCYIDDIEFLYD